MIKFYNADSQYVAILGSTGALLIFGEITPKSIALRFPKQWAKLSVRPLYFFYILISPLRYILIKLVNMLKGSEKDIYKKTLMSEEEFKILVELGKKEGDLELEESEMIRNVIEFEDLTVSKVMTPRADMFCLSKKSSFYEIMSSVEKFRFSRIPIYDDNIDNIVGILYSKELLHYLKKEGSEFKLESILHDPICVPGTKRLDELLAEFRKKKIHMAVVLDEYGGVFGLVTMEDLLEELFGEIKGEFDVEREALKKLSEESYLMSGMVSLEDFDKETGSNLSKKEPDIETIGGYLFHIFGKVPKKNETIENENIKFTIEKMKGARIVDIKVEMNKKDRKQKTAKDPLSGL